MKSVSPLERALLALGLLLIAAGVWWWVNSGAG